jgi:Fe-S-cluster-containing dehydrogenase component
VAFREREFPVGASELPEGVDRRQLVQILGASLGLAGLAGCRRPVEHIVPFVSPPEDSVPGMPKRYATTMPFGGEAYGLLVESHEGRPTKIEGNELHPATRGSASAQMQAAILGLYDPDRAAEVRARTAEGIQAKSWADFVAAWKGLETGLVASGGGGLAVLSSVASSPTHSRLAAALKARFPQLRWATWEPVGEENLLEAVRQATGRTLRPSYDLAKAKVILSIDADLFLSESGAVAHSKGFAAGRQALTESDEMNRLWIVESSHTTTGGMADHRLALPPSQLGAFAAALAQRLGVPGAAGGALPAGVKPRWFEALIQDLNAHRGSGLVVAGREQPVAVHGLALAINAALGNVGSTVHLREAPELLVPSTAELSNLVTAMQAGSVSTLVILSGNPLYDAPADLGFEAALGKVGTVLQLGASFNETSKEADWFLPEAHFLESWGDCRSSNGTLSVVQPLIDPLLGGKSAVELLGLLATGEDKPGYDLVRDTWRGLLPATEGAAFDNAFNKVLHDGLLEGGVPAPPDVSFQTIAWNVAGPPSGGLQVIFRASPAVHDGCFANLGWLQELPDAVTKLTWGNAVLLAPKTAQNLGLANEDGATVTVGANSVEMPVWIVPGQAEDTAVVHLGYGRTAAGRVGNGVGVNVYPLRASGAQHVAAASLSASGNKFRLAQTQDHGTMEGRPIVREASLEEWRQEPHFAPEMVEVPKSGPLWEPHKYDQGPQWGMTLDLNSCTGCNACVVACQSENNVPIVGHEQVRKGREMHWLRLDRYFSGTPEEPEMVFQPVPCMQCENAPCEQVCPVAATVHTEDGLNAMVYNRCIGTRYCSNNCPYKVRRFNFFNYTKDTPELLKMAANPEVTVRSRGVMEKCTYCVQRIQRARIDAKMEERPLKDGEIKTACQETCPTQAIRFGDIRDPESAVSQAKAGSRNYILLEELGNKPRTSYLARIRNPHPDLAEGA